MSFMAPSLPGPTPPTPFEAIHAHLQQYIVVQVPLRAA